MHLKSHSNGTTHKQNLRQPQSFECYVCQYSFPSTKALRTHIKKHIVYEQWVDPINVYLSNWCPEKSREILQNQPLVLVENLNIDNMNVDFSIGLNGRNEIEVGNGTDESNFAPNELVHNIEKMKVENGATVLPFTDGRMLTIIDECVTTDRINIELKPPINDESEKEQQIPSNRVADLALASDYEDISTAEQEPDTTVYVDDYEDGVVDVSSESDVDDILELFHCYFCDETFRSLEALGVHVKTCSFCP